MRERDLLMSQIQQDATKLEERVTIVKEEYETQLCDAKAQIDQVHTYNNLLVHTCISRF